MHVPAPRVSYEQVVNGDTLSGEDEEEWKVTPHPSRRLRGGRHNHTSGCDSLTPGKLPSLTVSPAVLTKELLIAKVFKQVELLRSVLDGERFWERYSYILCEFRNQSNLNIISLGIGSIENSSSSLFQFAFLLLLIEQLSSSGSNRGGHCLFFEPIATSSELEAIRHFGIDANLLVHKTLLEYFDSGPTILYMPHCDRSLYEWALWIQVEIYKVHHAITYIGNRFSSYSLETWDKLSALFEEHLLLIWESDYDRYIGCKEKRERMHFKPRMAKKTSSALIAYEAFNDLAFMSFSKCGSMESGRAIIQEGISAWNTSNAFFDSTLQRSE